MIFNCNFEDGTSLPIYVSADDLIENKIIDGKDLINYLWDNHSEEVVNFHFVNSNGYNQINIDLRKFEIKKPNLKKYIFDLVGKNLSTFNFPEIGSHEYLIGAMSVNDGSTGNLYIKKVMPEEYHDTSWQDEYYDPYADE